MIAKKRDASYSARIGHTLFLLWMEGHIQNGIKNRSKKIVGYVEDVTTRLCNVKSVKRE